MFFSPVALPNSFQGVQQILGLLFIQIRCLNCLIWVVLCKEAEGGTPHLRQAYWGSQLFSHDPHLMTIWGLECKRINKWKLLPFQELLLDQNKFEQWSHYCRWEAPLQWSTSISWSPHEEDAQILEAILLRQRLTPRSTWVYSDGKQSQQNTLMGK